MTRFSLALALVTGCIPIQTSTSTSTSTSRPMSTTSSQPAPAPAAPAASAADSIWFVSDSSSSWGPQIAVHVQEGTWLDEQGKPVVDGMGYRWRFGMRTNAATIATIKQGRPIIVSCNGQWYQAVTAEIDEAAGTINIGYDPAARCPTAIPVANARVIVEFKDAW